jgi:putative iron-dependent peroxidase
MFGRLIHDGPLIGAVGGAEFVHDLTRKVAMDEPNGRAVITAQMGIFALGDAAHGFFEFTTHPGVAPHDIVAAVADVRAPRLTVGGANVVIGFRPELWRTVVPDGIPSAVSGFDAPLRGPDGYTLPATQADLFVWISAAAYDIVFDLGVDLVATLAPLATLARETTGWSYKHSRDLTGFEDGTENPSLSEAPEIALVPAGEPGEGGSVLLFQQWRHSSSWRTTPVAEQERVIGRTKPDSIEFDDEQMPANSHVARNKVVENGEELKIFRRNVPYGTIVDHGTLFIGFSLEKRRMHQMLEQMVGLDGGPRDAITYYSEALTGAYYFVPSIQALRAFGTPPAD